MKTYEYMFCKPLKGVSKSYWIGIRETYGDKAIYPIAYLHPSNLGRKKNMKPVFKSIVSNLHYKLNTEL